MRFLRNLLPPAVGLFVAALAFAGPAPVVSPAEAGLQELIARQQTLLAGAERGGPDFDESRFQRQVQQLAFDYDQLLGRFPKFAPAFTAYAVLLGKLEPMRRQSAALLVKADPLYAEAAKDPAVRTPAFLKAWALNKNQLGNYVAEEGRPLLAVTHFLGAIDLVPDEPLYHYQLGTLLTEARDDFLKDGAWTREGLDKAMHDAFRKASELAPNRFEFAYRYAESFYDLAQPDWAAALKLWAALEEKAETPVERQTMRLHAANVLIKQGRFDLARAMMGAVTEPTLAGQKEKLVAQLPAETAK